MIINLFILTFLSAMVLIQSSPGSGPAWSFPYQEQLLLYIYADGSSPGLPGQAASRNTG
jgi:hypothetical protein